MMKKKFILLWPTLTWFREAITEESKKGEIDSIPVITSILKRIKKICEEATDFQDPKNLVRHSKGIQFFDMFKTRIGEILDELETVKELFK